MKKLVLLLLAVMLIVAAQFAILTRLYHRDRMPTPLSSDYPCASCFISVLRN